MVLALPIFASRAMLELEVKAKREPITTRSLK
jgi:hypothetical protein